MPARYLSLAAIALLSLPNASIAADMGEGIYERPPAPRAWCPPAGTPKAYYQRKFGQDNRPLLYVTPSPPVYQIYVEPRQAFIVSDSCPNQYRHNWYEGKLWYYDAGSPLGPDTFRIIRRD